MPVCSRHRQIDSLVEERTTEQFVTLSRYVFSLVWNQPAKNKVGQPFPTASTSIPALRNPIKVSVGLSVAPHIYRYSSGLERSKDRTWLYVHQGWRSDGWVRWSWDICLYNPMLFFENSHPRTRFNIIKQPKNQDKILKVVIARDRFRQISLRLLIYHFTLFE